MSRVQRQRPGGASPLRVSVEQPRVGDGPGQTPEVPKSRTPVPPDSGTPEVTESVGPEVQALQGRQPRYLTMERVEARLRPDQVEALGDLARRLQRARRSKDERITTNTLLRIAADLLLARADEIIGDTEVALRASLGLPNSRTPVTAAEIDR